MYNSYIAYLCRSYAKYVVPYLRIYYSWHKSNIYNVDTLYMRFMPYLSMHNPYIRSTYAKHAYYAVFAYVKLVYKA